MASSTERGYSFPCFKDKVVIITGSSSGIGAATAIEFAKDGAKLALTGRNAERLNAVAQKCISQGIPAGNILQMTGDIADDAFIEKFINETVTKLGGIDVLVNNAGAGESRTPGEFDKAQLDRALDWFVRSIYTTIRCCLPHLKKSKGNIINISSIAATQVGMYSCTEYCLAKSAMNHMASNLTYEFALDGVRINNISPGVIKTSAFTRSNDQELADKMITVFGKKSGFKRPGEPEEVASAVQFLASPAASYITGADLFVDGGQTKKPFLLPEELQ